MLGHHNVSSLTKGIEEKQHTLRDLGQKPISHLRGETLGLGEREGLGDPFPKDWEEEDVDWGPSLLALGCHGVRRGEKRVRRRGEEERKEEGAAGVFIPSAWSQWTCRGLVRYPGHVREIADLSAWHPLEG